MVTLPPDLDLLVLKTGFADFIGVQLFSNATGGYMTNVIDRNFTAPIGAVEHLASIKGCPVTEVRYHVLPLEHLLDQLLG